MICIYSQVYKSVPHAFLVNLVKIIQFQENIKLFNPTYLTPTEKNGNLKKYLEIHPESARW